MGSCILEDIDNLVAFVADRTRVVVVDHILAVEDNLFGLDIDLQDIDIQWVQFEDIEDRLLQLQELGSLVAIVVGMGKLAEEDIRLVVVHKELLLGKPMGMVVRNHLELRVEDKLLEHLLVVLGKQFVGTFLVVALR